MATGNVDLRKLLHIDFCVRFANSTAGKLKLLDEMCDLAAEEAQHAINKAKRTGRAKH